MAVWVEEMRVDNFKICLREAKIFDGLHKNIRIVSELSDVVFFFCRCIIILIGMWYFIVFVWQLKLPANQRDKLYFSYELHLKKVKLE